MQPMASSGTPGTQDGRGSDAERKRQLRTHEHQRFPGDRRTASSRSARNTMGGMPTPPPMASTRGRCGCGLKPVPIGPSTLRLLFSAARRQRARARTGHFVEQLDPAACRIGAHDGQRPSHGQLLGAAQVHEAAGSGARGTARGLQPQHVLLAVEMQMGEHAAPARAGWCRDGQHGGCDQAAIPPATASSTAMRTATPLLTCARITDCGPSATSEEISMPRFIGCGCITMASRRGAAEAGGAETVAREVLVAVRNIGLQRSAPSGCAAS